jgi:predicted molibdopterin-dependent oxidoreductase YjgC
MEVQINSNGKLIKVRQIQDTNKPLPNKGAFCIRGRFAHRAENSMAHLESATVSGKAVGASIALEEASKILKNANGNTVVTVSPHATIEEVALAKNVSMATGSKLVSVDMIREREAVAGLGKVLSVPASPKAVADIETSDCIFVVDCNPLKRAHVAGTRIRVAYENGKEVIVLSTDENSISKSASFNLRGKDGSAKAVMAAVLKKSLEAGSGALAGSEKVRSSLDKITADSLESASDIELSEIEDVVKRLSNAESPLIVIDMLSASEEVAALAAMTAATLSDSVDNIPLLALRDAANSDGLARMGVEVANLGDIDGKVILSIRENPLAFGGKAESLIVADALACEGANVMLMLPSLNEVSGTVCSTGGVLGTLCGTPAKKVSDCENIFASLADECCDAVEDMDKLSPVKFNEAVEVGDVLSGEKAKSPEIFADTFAAQFRNWAVERKFV